MLFLNGFHFISGAPNHYLQANHHCVVMDADFIQCAIYVPGSNPARLAGVEYIISGAAFAQLDYQERQLWHSHQYEVTSGYLTEPGMPQNVDDEVMKILVDSYGKTVHTWRYDQQNSTLPLGIPEMVNGYTQDGQLTQGFVDARDRYFGINSTAIREHRADPNAGNVSAPPVLPGADIWREGIVLTLELRNESRKVEFGGEKRAEA
ncbi:putative lipoprotein [Macrophomina phaseolina]|nr:putative lipoprotein [Macrophomina phaseolina]